MKEGVKELEEELQKGLNLGYSPEMTVAEGTSGGYWLLDSSKWVRGLFKPADEETLAPNNPRGYKG